MSPTCFRTSSWFLDRRDGTVLHAGGSAGGYAEFLADDGGWPAYRVALPAGSALVQAATGLTTRFGEWRAPGSPEQAMEFIDAHNGGAESEWGASGGTWHRRIAGSGSDGIQARVASRHSGTVIVLRQRRRSAGLRKSVTSVVGHTARHAHGPEHD